MPVLTSNLFQYAQLADASYAILGNETTNVTVTDPGQVSTALCETRGFTAAQANDFSTAWEVLSQPPNAASRFSAIFVKYLGVYFSDWIRNLIFHKYSSRSVIL